MAVLLLTSTVSWTVEQHFCMGRIYDYALFAKADKCGMELLPEQGFHSNDSCCDDEVISVDGRRDLHPSLNLVEIGQHYFTESFNSSYSLLSEIRLQRPLPNEYYPPPVIVRDIHLLEGVFLI